MKSPNQLACRIECQAREIGRLLGPSFASISILTCIYLVLNFHVFASFEISLDEEITPFFGAGGLRWISLDRFGLFLWERYGLHVTTAPVLPYFLSGIFLSTAYVVFSGLFRQRPLSFQMLFFFPIFSSFPTWFFLSEFSTNISGACLGVLLAGLALYFFSITLQALDGADYVRSIPAVISAIVLGALSIGMYQTFVLLLANVYVSYIIFRWRGLSLFKILRYGSIAFFLVAASYVLSSLICKGLRAYYGVGTAPYLGKILNPGTSLDSFVLALKSTLGTALLMLSGAAEVYGLGFGSLTILLVLSYFAVISRALWWQRARLLKMLFAASLIAFLVIPFVHEVYWGARPFLRSYVALPYTIWFLVFLGWHLSGWTVRLIAVPVTLVFYFQVLKLIAGLNSTNALTMENDKILASMIFARVAEVAASARIVGKMPVIFHGRRHYSTIFAKPKGSTTGLSIFATNSTGRMVHFMWLMGLDEIGDGSVGLPRGEFDANFKSMETWPSPNSVQAVQQRILVKLGP